MTHCQKFESKQVLTKHLVMEYVLKGWQVAKDDTDKLAQEYWSFREELSIKDGLLFKYERIVVPRAMRAKVLDEIQGAHMGESKSLSFARDHVFWPAMTFQARDRVLFMWNLQCFQELAAKRYSQTT